MELDYSLPRMIAKQIAADIFNRELKPGQKVIEERYAERFNISRAPVREALYLLATEGLVERVPRRGSFVKRYTKRDIKDLYEMRLSIELMAIQRIKQPFPREHVEKMEQILTKMTDAAVSEDRETYTELNREYHLQLIKLSKSTVFENIYSQLGSPLVALQKISFSDAQNMENSLEDHKLLWKLLLSGKNAIAEGVLKEHNKLALERVRQQIDQGGKVHEGHHQSLRSKG